MSKQTINIGASPNDGTGTPLRTSFDYCNQNFTELYTATGPSGNNIVVPGNATITGDLTVDTSTLKVDSANDRVGIQSTLLNSRLTVRAGTIAGIDIYRDDSNANFSGIRFKGTTNSTVNAQIGWNGTQIRIDGTDEVLLVTNSSDRFRITTGGVFTWENVGGVAGTAMTLNSTGLGVGVVPTAQLASYKSFQFGIGGNLIGRSDNAGIELSSNSYRNTGGNYIYLNTDFAASYRQYSGQHEWFNAPSGTAANAVTFTQAMTLDANGRLLIGKTASALSTVGLEEAAGGYIQSTVTSDASLFCNRLATDGETIKFYRQTVQVGNISVTTTATAYNTSSDYRLKESAQPLVGGLARVNALKPSVYKWKANGSAGEGFLAHELAEVVPLAVTGDKDAVDADGKPTYQGVDLSKVIPVLVAAIQELTAEVNALKNA
jgi:hypothetical protein